MATISMMMMICRFVERILNSPQTRCQSQSNRVGIEMSSERQRRERCGSKVYWQTVPDVWAGDRKIPHPQCCRRPAVCCGVVLPVCPCHARLVADILAGMSRGCYEQNWQTAIVEFKLYFSLLYLTWASLTYVDGEVLVGKEKEPLDTVVKAAEQRVSVDVERSTAGGRARQIEHGRHAVHDEAVAQWAVGERREER